MNNIRHYALQVDIERARRIPYPIVALCGHVWIPNTTDNKELPTCTECQTTFDKLLVKDNHE